MTHYDQILHDPEHAPSRRPAARRVVLLTLIALCGLLIVGILLSNPRVSRTLGGAAGTVAVQINQILPTAPEDAPTSAVISPPRPVEIVPDAGNLDNEPLASGERPAVRRLPQSRIPVRRAGVAAEN